MEENKKIYSIERKTLVDLSNEIRRLAKTENGYTPQEMIQFLRDVMLSDLTFDAYETNFGPEQIEPDANYRINYNWFAEIVKIIEEMSATTGKLNPNQILHNLKLIAHIPQGRGQAHLNLEKIYFSSTVTNYIPVSSECVESFGISDNNILATISFKTYAE